MNDYNEHYGIKKIRPIFNEDTALRDIPRRWLQYVEPKIVRRGFNGCWISLHGQSKGYPTVYYRDNEQLIKTSLRKFVMRIFYDFPDEYKVINTCEHIQCVNPNHLYLTLDPKEQTGS